MRIHHGYPSSRRSRASVILSTLAAIAACLTVALHHRAGSAPSAAQATRDTVTPPGPHPTYSSSTPSSAPVRPAQHLTVSNDPAHYAQEVATSLFGTDPSTTTRTSFLQFWRAQLPTVVYSDAASKGLTLTMQNADAVNNLTTWWIPSPAAWASEANENTTNTFAVTSITVPDYWANAVAEGKFRDPGLRVERVMGVLTQSYGTDPTHRYRSQRPIVIDLALLCGPTQPGGCRLVAPQQPPGNGAT